MDEPSQARDSADARSPSLDEGVLAKIQRLASLALHAPAATFTAAEVPGAEACAPAFGPGPDAFCRRVWQLGEPVVIEDTERDPRVVFPTPGIRGYLGVPLRDRDGAVIGTLSVRDPAPRGWTAEDVELLEGLADGAATELLLRRELEVRQRVEQAVRDAEERFHAFMDNSPVIAFVKDAEGRYRYVNAEFERRFDTTREEALGATDSRYMSPEQADEVARIDQELIASGGTKVYLVRGNPPDSRGTIWQVFKFVFGTASERRLLGAVALDVTERETAAAAMRASEERYRRIVEAAGDIIYEADVYGNFTYANPSALRILGYETGEVLGRHYSELIRPDYRGRAAELYQRQVFERIPTTYFEFPAVSRDGRDIWIGQVVQLVMEDGRIRGLHAVARDISARHEVERMKDEFISIVSHELRTPLTSIRGSLGLLGSGKLGELGDRAQRLVEIATDNSERLIRLINDILDIERIESGAIEMNARPVSSAELVTQAVDTVRGMAERARVALETDVRPFELSADPDRIVQVLTNLISNAVKFSPADAGSVVTIEARAEEEKAYFRVTDRGRGIPSDKLESIFERFQQVDSSDSRQKGGTGLGLAISRTIVQQHGGEIRVSSELGRGSTFTFTLPLAAAS
jgi:PAS domain S-box-containing protein